MSTSRSRFRLRRDMTSKTTRSLGCSAADRPQTPAAALARLGVPCRFVGTVGDDLYGRFAIADLAAVGVDTQAVTMTASDPTVMVIAIIQPDGERLIYVWPPTGGAHGALSAEAAVAAVEGATWLHVSGICLRVSPAADGLLAAMERARAAGVPVSFDLNLRLENWGWDDGFRGTVMAAVDTLMSWSAGEPTRSGCSPVSIIRSRPPGR